MIGVYTFILTPKIKKNMLLFCCKFSNYKKYKICIHSLEIKQNWFSSK